MVNRFQSQNAPEKELQERAGDVKTLSEDELRKNTSASVSPRDVHLVFTNKTLPQDWKGILRECNPEATFGAVHGGNFKSYFGPFAPFWTGAHCSGIGLSCLVDCVGFCR